MKTISIKDLLKKKINPDDLKKLDLNETVTQTHTQDEIKEFGGELNPGSTGPIHHTPVERYFRLNNFRVTFSDPFIVPEKYITAISKPTCDIITGEFRENKITMTFQYIKEKHYFGKPSVYDNMFLDSEVWESLVGLNRLEIGHIKVEELDEEGNPKIETKYYHPIFLTLDCAPNNSNDTSIKYFTVEISFDRSEQKLSEEDILEETEE